MDTSVGRVEGCTGAASLIAGGADASTLAPVLLDELLYTGQLALKVDARLLCS